MSVRVRFPSGARNTEPTQKQFWAGFSFQDEAVLFRQGSGFDSIHPPDEFDSISLALSGAAHEAAADHALPDSMQLFRITGKSICFGMLH